MSLSLIKGIKIGIEMNIAKRLKKMFGGQYWLLFRVFCERIQLIISIFSDQYLS